MSSPTYIRTYLQPAPALKPPQGGAHASNAKARETVPWPLQGSSVITKTLTAVVFLIAGLLAVVIVVGLARDQLDPTGVAAILASALSGLVGGILLRERSKGP